MEKLLVVLLLFSCISSAYGQQAALKGHWQGHINVQGQQLIIKTHFTGDDSLQGTIDIPQQLAKGLPFQKIQVTKSDSVFFEFMAGPGNMVSFEGLLKKDITITGSFHQQGMEFPFELKRYKPEAETDTKQAQTKAPPYYQNNLIIKNDSIKIGGTLTWPKDEQTNQLVIMISGSGAQDRDMSMKPISDFKPFALLADSLTTAGIATFRYDDRGVGQSTGSFGHATLDMLADDVGAIIAEFTGGSGRGFDEIILLGHSQGGIVGSKTAAENDDVNKLILMASPGVGLKKVLRFQVKQLFQNVSIDSQLVEEEIAAREQFMEAIRTTKEIAKARENYQERFAAIQMVAGADSAQANSLAENQAQQLQKAYESPQMQSLLFYDPAQDLKQLDIPVLVLFGGKDTQITVEMNKKPIEEALEKAHGEYESRVFENANHPFQKAETGELQEYGQLENTFVNGFLKTIEQWIKKEY